MNGHRASDGQNVLTPIGSRLTLSLDSEFLRMANEWFFKWHFIGRDSAVEIESFSGRPICYGGVAYAGSPVDVYWDTIQRYLRIKVATLFDELESQLARYPIEIRVKALNESQVLLNGFAAKIRNKAIDTDRTLRGNGMEFPAAHDRGRWTGSTSADIASRTQVLKDIYCTETILIDGAEMPLRDLMRDKVTLVKKDGTIFRSDIQAAVTPGRITTFASDLPIEVGDHFLRQLPSGLVEDYIVNDPGFSPGLGSIGAHFQVRVRRSDAPVAQPQTIINNFSGHNARVNVNSVDNSVNNVTDGSDAAFDGISSVITSSISEAAGRDALLALVQELKVARGSPGFKEKYQSFISLAANHMTLLAPFIPALTAHL
jgi:hypothetical protein